MADVRIEFNCPNHLCKRPYHVVVHTTGEGRPAVQGGTFVFRCANPNCKALILAVFVGERSAEVKWLGEEEG